MCFVAYLLSFCSLFCCYLLSLIAVLFLFIVNIGGVVCAFCCLFLFLPLLLFVVHVRCCTVCSCWGIDVGDCHHYCCLLLLFKSCLLYVFVAHCCYTFLVVSVLRSIVVVITTLNLSLIIFCFLLCCKKGHGRVRSYSSGIDRLQKIAEAERVASKKEKEKEQDDKYVKSVTKLQALVRCFIADMERRELGIFFFMFKSHLCKQKKDN